MATRVDRRHLPGFDELSRTVRLRRRLLARIHRNYRTVERELAFGHLRIRFTQIENADHVLDRVVAEADRREKISGIRQREDDDELHLPYWAELWDSAIGIGQWLVEHRRAVKGHEDSTGGARLLDPSDCRVAPSPARPLSHPLSVLDLGCGMGLAGTVAAALGHQVLFADIETPPLLFARLNSAAYASRVRARRVDWKHNQLRQRFDLIIGADVLYDRSQWEHLEPFFRAHLSSSARARVVLGEPGRQTGEMFVPWIVGRGWKLEQSAQSVAGREKPVRVLRISL